MQTTLIHRTTHRLIAVLLLLIGTIIGIAQESTTEPAMVFSGRVYDHDTDITTFTYQLTAANSQPGVQQLVIEIPICQNPLEVLAYTPFEGASFGDEPSTNIRGILWDLSLEPGQSRTFSLSLSGIILTGSVRAVVQSGGTPTLLTIPGPSCTAPGIVVEQTISIDGGITYLTADQPPGVDVDLDTEILHRIVITNTGTTALSQYTLTNDRLDLSTCNLPDELAPGATIECSIGPVAAETGQNMTTTSITGMYDDGVITSSHTAYFWGGLRPELQVFKFITLNDGATWLNASVAPGPQVTAGDRLSYRLVISNSGNVTLTQITAADSMTDLSDCNFSLQLEPGYTEECLIESPLAGEGLITNTLTVTAYYEGAQQLIRSATAHYTVIKAPTAGDLPIIIRITGPVDSIINNVITVFGTTIHLDPDDPILNIIRIGDVIQIEGEMLESTEITAITALSVAIINVEVFVALDGITAWRDDSNCNNPPPDWAAAHGWRQRCDPNYTGAPGRSRR